MCSKAPLHLARFALVVHALQVSFDTINNGQFTGDKFNITPSLTEYLRNVKNELDTKIYTIEEITSKLKS
jgi:hypothetical protein